jgi:hypothetical protein
VTLICSSAGADLCMVDRVEGFTTSNPGTTVLLDEVSALRYGPPCEDDAAPPHVLAAELPDWAARHPGATFATIDARHAHGLYAAALRRVSTLHAIVTATSGTLPYTFGSARGARHRPPGRSSRKGWSHRDLLDRVPAAKMAVAGTRASPPQHPLWAHKQESPATADGCSLVTAVADELES